MRSVLGSLTVAGLVALGGSAHLVSNASHANAQSACMTQCKDNGWSESSCSSYCLGNPGNPARVYGYYRRYGYGPDARTRSAERFGGCGEFHYWNGLSCVDARIDPPKID
jgi:hypothetical protein